MRSYLRVMIHAERCRVSSALSLIGGVHIGARALLDIDKVWPYRSPILLVHIISTCLLGAYWKVGRGSAPCGSYAATDL
jgi:hypothetical protein